MTRRLSRAALIASIVWLAPGLARADTPAWLRGHWHIAKTYLRTDSFHTPGGFASSQDLEQSNAGKPFMDVSRGGIGLRYDGLTTRYGGLAVRPLGPVASAGPAIFAQGPDPAYGNAAGQTIQPKTEAATVYEIDVRTCTPGTGQNGAWFDHADGQCGPIYVLRAADGRSISVFNASALLVLEKASH